jgi:HEPN domain-containing protein
MKRLTTEWVEKAETDFLAAKALAREVLPLHEPVCFHCQQAAEKYLKALLKRQASRFRALMILQSCWHSSGHITGCEVSNED